MTIDRVIRPVVGLATRTRVASFGILAGLMAFVAPRVVLACAVCSAGRDDESNTAFLISTIFLSVLPLAGLGTLVLVLWRRIQRLEADAPRGADERATSPLGGAPIAGATSVALLPTSPRT